MSNRSSTCPAPFLSRGDFGNGGYLAGRFCGENPVEPGTYCCLPCPAQQWIYSDGQSAGGIDAHCPFCCSHRIEFLYDLKLPEWLSLASLIPLAFLLLSWLVLNSERVHRHYLSVGLVISLVLIQLAFIIPLATKPAMCHDKITPNDMHDSLSCAWSGACFQAGGLAAAVWILLRNLWFHIRVCWDRSPGKAFVIGSFVAGTIVPIVCLIAATVFSGYSFRLGSTCVINHEHSFAVFWGWLLAFAGLAFILQCITTGYAAGVYLRIMAQERAKGGKANASDSSAGRKLTGAAAEEAGAGTTDCVNMNAVVSHNRQRWRKLRRLFILQWRQLVISVLVVIESVFFVVVFWSQDRQLHDVEKHPQLQSQIQLWSYCLIAHKGDKTPCLELVKPFVRSPSTTLASFILSALIGLQVSLILVRRSIFEEWYSLLKRSLRWSETDGSQPSRQPSGYSEQPLYGRRREQYPRMPKFGGAFSGTLFMGSSNRGMKRRSYFSSWTGSRRERSPTSLRQDMAQRDSWGWYPRRDSSIIGAQALDYDAESPQLPRGRPGWVDAIPRTLVRDTSGRPSSLRLETHAEAMRRQARMEAGDRDSMVLGVHDMFGVGGIVGGDAADEVHLDGRDQAAVPAGVSVNPLRMDRPTVAEPVVVSASEQVKSSPPSAECSARRD